MKQSINPIVLVVAERGTRFVPITSVRRKDRQLIQYAGGKVLAVRLVFITYRIKEPLPNRFDKVPRLGKIPHTKSKVAFADSFSSVLAPRPRPSICGPSEYRIIAAEGPKEDLSRSRSSFRSRQQRNGEPVRAGKGRPSGYSSWPTRLRTSRPKTSSSDCGHGARQEVTSFGGNCYATIIAFFVPPSHGLESAEPLSRTGKLRARLPMPARYAQPFTPSYFVNRHPNSLPPKDGDGAGGCERLPLHPWPIQG
jgi:hypothetical protein